LNFGIFNDIKEKQKNLVTQSNWNKLLKKSILKKSVEVLRSAGNYKIFSTGNGRVTWYCHFSK